MNKPLKFRLYTLMPVHIGCDEVYEPTGFVIDDQTKKLIEFDPLGFVKSLKEEDRKELLKKCEDINLLDIFKFIRSKYQPTIGGKSVEIASGLLEHYKKVLAMKAFNEETVINQFTMNKTAFNPYNGMAYIPGSSIKGAIRTAYLSKLAVDKNIRGRKGTNPPKKLEEELLGGSFDTDPFRLVKVSDFLPAGEVKTKVVYAVNKKKKTSKYEARGPFQIFEVIKEGSVFEGVINIQPPAGSSGIISPVTKDDLIESTHNFYSKLASDEAKILSEIKINATVVRDIVSKLTDVAGKSVFLLRVGRHSGAAAVTIEGNRDIKIMQGRDERGKTKYIYQSHAETLWLASENSKPANNTGLVPFGWALLEIADEGTSKVEPLLSKSSLETPAANITPPPKPPPPAKPEFDSFKDQIEKLDFKGQDWGRRDYFQQQVKKMQNAEDKKKSAQLLKEKIEKERKPKDYNGKPWYDEIGQLCK